MIAINKQIHEWVFPNLKGRDEFEPFKYTTSLDAMSRAEAEATKRNLFYRYACKIAEVVMGRDWQRNFSVSFFNLLTAPAHVRAKALAEVLDEVGS